MKQNESVSLLVVRRLPRYYRFLTELKKSGIVRISSKELAKRMGLTASQIRQDLNCFGGFGQQGYGYNVDQLSDEIERILYLDISMPAI
ncbi:MAG: winged-helix domain-containing protein, partial [Oscillospiraceae bacterium]